MSVHSVKAGNIYVGVPTRDPAYTLAQPLVAPKLGAIYVRGAVVDEPVAEVLTPPGLYAEVRRDLRALAPITVSRVALKFASHAYVGIIDSEGAPHYFALGTRGLALRKAPDTDLVWQTFDALIASERARAVAARRTASTVEQHAMNVEMERPQLVVTKSLKAKGPGSRGSKKLWFDKRGKPRYDDRPISERHVGVTVNAKHDLDYALGKEIHRRVAKKKPKTAEQLRSVLYDICVDMGDSHVEAKRYAGSWMHELHEHGSISLDTGPRDDADSATLVGQLRATKEMFKQGAEKFFKVQKGLARPVLAKMFASTGAKLIVDGKPVKVSPDAEQACLAYAKRFVVNAGTVKHRGAFDRGFHKSLQRMGVPKGAYDFSQFARAVEKAPPPEKRAKSTDVPTPETHPNLFVVRDGQHVRLADARVPMGNFYTGKDGYGTWARALTEKDLTWNGTPPSGWKGQVINDPTKRYVMTWIHPDTKEPGYVYPADSVVGGELRKFERSAKLARHVDGIRPMITHDAEHAKDPKVRASALCAYLIDKEKFRPGGEQYDTTGVGSLLAENVKVDGKHVVFEFTGKKGVDWRRVVDFTKLPEALAFIKECKRGKKPGDKLWAGSGWRTDDKAINAYLARFPVDGDKITAKDFRTFHANAYVREMLPRLAEVEKSLGLSTSTVKKLLAGVDVRDPKHADVRKALAQTYRGKSVRDHIGIQEYTEGKKRLYGIVPTVAHHLGHTPSSSRNSYIDPVAICKFAADRGWDARTPKEKKHRADLAKPSVKASPATSSGMLHVIATESKTPQEFARRADAWRAGEAKKPSDAQLAAVFAQDAKGRKAVHAHLAAAAKTRTTGQKQLWDRMAANIHKDED